MYTPSFLQSTSILSILILNHYALVTASPLLTRQSPSCTDINAPFNSTCWENLKLDDFLTNHKTGWNATLGKPCQPGDNPAFCCRSQLESWSSCFLRQSIDLKDKTISCATTNSSNCPTTSLTLNPQTAPAAQPKVRYILHNIYTIYNLFTTWDSLLPLATTDAKTSIRYQTLEVDPQGTTSLLAPTVIQAFLLGLPYLGHPNATNLVYPPIPAQTNHTARALLAALQHAPAVSRSIFVNASATIYPVQSVGVADFLAGNYGRGQLDSRLNAGLGLIMRDLGTFVKFAAEGGFSGARNDSISDPQGFSVMLHSVVASTVRKDRVYANQVTGLGIGLNSSFSGGLAGM